MLPNVQDVRSLRRNRRCADRIGRMKASQAARLAKGHEGLFLAYRGLAQPNKLSKNGADCAFRNITSLTIDNTSNRIGSD